MTQDEIINHIIVYLNGHLNGTRGGIGETIYKGDFFKLFKEAYHNGYFDESSRAGLRGDALRDIIVERWFTGDDAKDEKRWELMSQFSAMWDEWRYAWDHRDD